MASQVGAALTRLQSLLMATGLFKMVDTVEPKDPPQTDTNIVAAIYLAGIKPIRLSTLASGTCVYTFTVRLYSNAFQDPADRIDPDLIIAVDKVFDALCGDFDLGDYIRNIDILGEASDGLGARAGHVTVAQTVFRCIDINVPLIVNDVIVFTP